MPAAKKWNLMRKTVGNVVPLALAFPLALVVGQHVAMGEITMTTVYYGIGFLVALWLATALLGNIGHAGIRKSLAAAMNARAPFDKSRRIFVGFSTAKYKNILDAHEDVGYLVLRPEALEFFGTHHNPTISKSRVTSISFKRNAHTLVGFGGWIVIQADFAGKKAPIYIEPREKATLFGNARYRKRLKIELEQWKREAGSESEPPEESSQITGSGQDTI